jgi:hypothetical protein
LAGPLVASHLRKVAILPKSGKIGKGIFGGVTWLCMVVRMMVG